MKIICTATGSYGLIVFYINKTWCERSVRGLEKGHRLRWRGIRVVLLMHTLVYSICVCEGEITFSNHLQPLV